MKKIRLLLLFFWIFCLSFVTSQLSEAKMVQGSCGGRTEFCYDSSEKILKLTGSGAVTKTISVKKQLGRDTQNFSVKQLRIGKGITTIQDASVLKYAEGNIQTVSLPEGFQTIPENMFSNLSVCELRIPGSVTEIRKGAFWDQLLEKITVSTDNQNYSSQDGVLYNKNKSCLLYYPPDKENRSFAVPDSVRQIEDLAFHGNYYLRRVSLPVDLQKLGAGCFYECIALEKINISKLHQLREIRDYHNKSDIRIEIPYQSEGDDNDIVYQDYLIYQNNDPDDDSYRANAYLDYYNGTDGVDSQDKEYFGTFEGTALSSFVMPNRMEYIASETFRNCVPLHTFTIGKAYRGQINQTAYSQTSLSLYYLEIHDLKIHPENTAFVLEDHLLYSSDKTVLCQEVCDQEYAKDTLTISSGVKRIADGAFYMDTLYQNIVVEGDLEEIGVAAFAGSRIRSFTAKGRIDRLKKGAFMYCGDMSGWQCEDHVSTMEKNIFLGDGKLDHAETGGIFSCLQLFREGLSLRNLAAFPAWISILFS